jgi:hypothetical protein
MTKKNFIKIISSLSVLLSNSAIHGQVNLPPKGDPRKESASVDISLFQTQLDFMVKGVNDGVDAISIDWPMLDNKIENWFNQKKKDPGWNPITKLPIEKYNELVEDTKRQARLQLNLMVSSWNQAVSNEGKKLSDAIVLFWKAGPYGKVEGIYEYQEGAEKPGDPGWTLNELVIIYNFIPVEISGSFGVAEVELKAAASLDAFVAGASAEIITKLSSEFSLSAYLKLPYQLDPPQQPLAFKPLPPAPPNMPIAKTGFQSSIAVGYKVSYKLSALLSINGWVSVGPRLVDLGVATADIEKGTFKKVAANP